LSGDAQSIKTFLVLKKIYKIPNGAECWWLMPVILATQEAEIRRIAVRSQPRQKSVRPYPKTTPSKKEKLRNGQSYYCI
jgi:hypothetical protein